MNAKRKIFTIFSLLIVFSMIFGTALADDGKLYRRNISQTPDAETSQSIIYMMDFYVPSQDSKGNLKPLRPYYLADGTEAFTGTDANELPTSIVRNYAKPLVTVYNDDVGSLEVDTSPITINGAMSFGEFDGFAAISWDDGNSWQRTNLSNSAHLSSINIDGIPYPGDVNHIVHQVFGDKIFVAWASRYCDDGRPLYQVTNNADAYADYLTDLTAVYDKDTMYLYDLFGVNGNQGTVNYTTMGFPEVGEVPYNCIWTARGQILPGDQLNTETIEGSYVLWTQPERLTSGVRDANLPAVDCARGAGCILTWQEDPEGLRPGLGLGPGEGWSGAVAWQQTDIWYSYISDADFDLVWAAPDRSAIGAVPLDVALIDDLTLSYDLSPNSLYTYVPMAMPVRITDNAMCKAVNSYPYCYIDFDNIDTMTPADALGATQSTDSDFCTSTQLVTMPTSGNQINICVAEDDRLMLGRVASTRVRMNLKPYTPADAGDADLDGTIDISAWAVFAAEESKGLGYTADSDDVDPIDIGKDMWYYSFDMFDHAFVDQGGILNQPSIDPVTGDGPTIETDDLTGTTYYLTEIARRFSVTTNSVAALTGVIEDSGVPYTESGLSAMLIYKQGIINQGGPADIFLRRVIVPDDWDPFVDNPYAYENMECDEWDLTDGSNPNYLNGICLSPAINISGTTAVDCAACDPATFPWDGSAESDFPKMLEWRNCDGAASISSCTTDNDLDDQSWDSPTDVSKGHRGFLDGDIVMIMYAYSPNWKANSVGNDHYNLYVRRSFDGGLTWTTTPGTLGGLGTSAIEYYRTEGGATEETLFSYAAGAFEQARNVSLLTGNKITILDPRYSPTGGLKLYPSIRVVDEFLLDTTLYPTATDVLPYEDIGDATRDRSKYFMIYETGDNTTVTIGEATPMDLFYSRAYNYGDNYEWAIKPSTETLAEPYLTDWWANENEDDILSGEASMLCTPGGLFAYIVWNQWQEDEHENISNSDQIFQRLLYLDDDTVVETVPIAWITSAPSSALWGSLITLMGTGRDIDNPAGESGIVSYDWYSSINGHIGSGMILTIPSDQLSIGRHIISLVVTDDEGVQSTPVTAILVVDGTAFHVTLPMIRR